MPSRRRVLRARRRAGRCPRRRGSQPGPRSRSDRCRETAAGRCPAEATAAQRLPDGSLFVPKAVQRQLGLRHVLAHIDDLAATVEFNGKVIADPNAGGRVQATQSGRLEAGPKGLPTLGRKVVKGRCWLICARWPAASNAATSRRNWPKSTPSLPSPNASWAVMNNWKVWSPSRLPKPPASKSMRSRNAAPRSAPVWARRSPGRTGVRQ